MKRIYSLLLILASIMLSGCSQAGNINQEITGKQNVNTAPAANQTASPIASPQTREYSKSLDELRANFNRDKGKVRLLTLLSPT